MNKYKIYNSTITILDIGFLESKIDILISNIINIKIDTVMIANMAPTILTIERIKLRKEIYTYLTESLIKTNTDSQTTSYLDGKPLSFINYYNINYDEINNIKNIFMEMFSNKLKFNSGLLLHIDVITTGSTILVNVNEILEGN